MKTVRFNHTTWTIDAFLTVLTEVTATGSGQTVSLNKLTADERKVVFNQII